MGKEYVSATIFSTKLIEEDKFKDICKTMYKYKYFREILQKLLCADYESKLQSYSNLISNKIIDEIKYNPIFYRVIFDIQEKDTTTNEIQFSEYHNLGFFALECGLLTLARHFLVSRDLAIEQDIDGYNLGMKALEFGYVDFALQAGKIDGMLKEENYKKLNMGKLAFAKFEEDPIHNRNYLSIVNLSTQSKEILYNKGANYSIMDKLKSYSVADLPEIVDFQNILKNDSQNEEANNTIVGKAVVSKI